MIEKKMRLLLFTRYPEPGTTKTRLIPQLGRGGAAALQKRLTQHIFNQALSLTAESNIGLEVWYSGGDEQKFRSWLGTAAGYRQQSEGDIGKRMQHAFNLAFAEGAQRVVLIGSDVPAITGEILRSAFACLVENDSVIGPVHDGGYYLVGLNRSRGTELAGHIFSGILWSTGTVYRQTLSLLQQHHASVAGLPMLRDIDRPEDIEEVRKWLPI